MSHLIKKTTVQLATYAQLRAYGGPQKSVRLTGYLATAKPQGIAGEFVRDDSDTTSADDGGTVIVAGAVRWKRVYTGPVNFRWFGGKGDGVTDDINAIDAAIACIVKAGGGALALSGMIGVSRKIKVRRGVVLQGEPGFDYSAYPTIHGTVIKPLAGYADPEVVLFDSAFDNTPLQSGNGLTDIAVDMANIAVLGARAVCFRSVTNFGPVRNVAVFNLDHGIALDLDQTGVASPNATDGVDIVNFFSYGKTVGYVSNLPRLQITNSVNEIAFRGCKFQSKSNAAAGTLAARIYSGARGITFDGSSFAGCETGVLIYANAANNSPPEWVRFFNNTWEAYRIGIYIDSASADPSLYPRRIHLDRSNRFITALGDNCRKVSGNRVLDSYFEVDEWIEASTNGTASKLIELTAAAVGCTVHALPDDVINASASSVVFGRKAGALQVAVYREPVKAAALANNWVNGSPASRTSAGYSKDAQNIIRLQAWLNGGAFGSGAANYAFQLPAGYWPAKSMEFLVPCTGGAAMVLVSDDGKVYPVSGNGYVCLDGISFPAA